MNYSSWYSLFEAIFYLFGMTSYIYCLVLKLNSPTVKSDNYYRKLGISFILGVTGIGLMLITMVIEAAHTEYWL